MISMLITSHRANVYDYEEHTNKRRTFDVHCIEIEMVEIVVELYVILGRKMGMELFKAFYIPFLDKPRW